VATGLLAAVVGAALMLGDWQSAAALTVLVLAGLVLLAVTLTPAAWMAAGVAAIILLVHPPGAAVIDGLVLFVGAALALPGRWLRIAVAAGGALILVAGLALQATQPHPDDFYAAPDHLPAGHGVLVRSAPFTSRLPTRSRAWRILYTTTRGDGTPTVASAVVVAATQAPPGPRPVVVWAHGASGIAPDCAPSLGTDPVGAGSIPDVAEALAAGWVVIAPDYPGLGTVGPHPFLIGQGEARSLLDAVLATHGLTTLTLAAQTLIWGHSQGGNAALWSGIIAPSYAPAVGLAGVAALAPGTGLPALAVQWGDQIYAAYLIEAYSETYPDVRFDAYVRAAVRVQVHELAGRCPSDRLVSALSSLLVGRSIWSAAPGTGAFGDRLRQNIPDQPIGVPVLIAQGDNDTTVPVAVQNDYVRQECTTGTRLDYRTYPGRDHVGIFTGDSPLLPDLMQWSRDRLTAAPARSTC
jgi:alpha-beta hydrolase superfamily lysophospholipase